MPIVKTLREAAKIIGVSERTLTSWRKLPGFPGKPRSFDTDEISKWDAARDLQRRRPGTDAAAAAANERQSLNREKLRGMKLDNDIKELQQRQKRGELIDVKHLEEIMNVFSTHIRRAAVAMQKGGHLIAGQILDEHLQKSIDLVGRYLDRAVQKD